MSALDKAKNKAEWLAGRTKEMFGQATGDKSKEHEGKADQAKANLKATGENVKDTLPD